MRRESPGHWDRVFAERRPDEVSWYQPSPETSLRLLADVAGSVIDIGAGASTLVDALLDAARCDITLLDISAQALQVTRDRLGPRASAVTFLVADLRTWTAEHQYDVWHDRAVFHFLTTVEEQDRYVGQAAAAVRPGGAVVLGTFAEDGPEMCSGLPTARYSAEQLADRFAPAFILEHAEREVHATPAGHPQPFTWVRLRRT